MWTLFSPNPKASSRLLHVRLPVVPPPLTPPVGCRCTNEAVADSSSDRACPRLLLPLAKSDAQRLSAVEAGCKGGNGDGFCFLYLLSLSPFFIQFGDHTIKIFHFYRFSAFQLGSSVVYFYQFKIVHF